MDNLIIDILTHIAFFISNHDLLNYGLTCKKFSTILTNENFWRLKVTSLYPTQQKVTTWKNTYLAVTRKLYVFGYTICSNSEKYKNIILSPTDLFGDIPIDSVKCGCDFTEVISNNKKLTIGKDICNREEIHRGLLSYNFDNTKIKFSYGGIQIAIISDKQLYVSRFVNYYGDDVHSEYKHVEFFADMEVTGVSCGMDYIAIVADDKLYTYGSGICGRLGHGSEKDITEPTQVKAFENMKVTMVSCGDYHTAVVADKKLYTFGSNWGGKSGHGDQTNIYYPKHVECFQDVITVSCGSDHTAVIARKIV
jgi:hypothetical protein